MLNFIENQEIPQREETCWRNQSFPDPLWELLVKISVSFPVKVTNGRFPNTIFRTISLLQYEISLTDCKKKKAIQTKYRMPLFNWQALKSNQVAGTIFSEVDDERILEVCSCFLCCPKNIWTWVPSWTVFTRCTQPT